MSRQIVQLSELSEGHTRACARGKIQLNQLNQVLSRARSDSEEGTICFSPGSYPCVTFRYIPPVGVCICKTER